MSVLAVVDPNSLAGTELRQELRQHRELWSEVRLLASDADPEIATLSELDGAMLVQPLSAEQLDGVDLMFLCDGYDEAEPPWSLLPAGATTVLVSPERTPQGGVPVVSGVNLEAATRGGLLVSPHPAVVLLALLLDPLRPLGLADATAWLVQPATMRGRQPGGPAGAGGAGGAGWELLGAGGDGQPDPRWGAQRVGDRGQSARLIAHTPPPRSTRSTATGQSFSNLPAGNP